MSHLCFSPQTSYNSPLPSACISFKILLLSIWCHFRCYTFFSAPPQIGNAWFILLFPSLSSVFVLNVFSRLHANCNGNDYGWHRGFLIYESTLFSSLRHSARSTGCLFVSFHTTSPSNMIFSSEMVISVRKIFSKVFYDVIFSFYLENIL